MRIGSIYPTYVYNTNYVSSKSLGRVDAIADDALQSKVGYGSSYETTNPLRPGTSKDLAGILASQFAMGRMNAARLLQQPQTDASAAGQTEEVLTDRAMTESVDAQLGAEA